MASDLELPSSNLPNGEQAQVEKENSDGHIDKEKQGVRGQKFENDEKFDINKVKTEGGTNLPTESSENAPSNNFECKKEEVELESLGESSDAHIQNEPASSGPQHLENNVELDVTKVETDTEDSPDKNDDTNASNPADCTEGEIMKRRGGNETGRKQLVIPEVREEDEDSW